MKKYTLIVEDDEATRIVLKQFVETECKTTVYTAKNLSQAEAHIKGVKYDCILLDLFLCGEFSNELIPLIRQIQPQAEILLMSAHPKLKVIAEAYKVNYMSKPFDIERLKNHVDTICSKK